MGNFELTRIQLAFIGSLHVRARCAISIGQHTCPGYSHNELFTDQLNSLGLASLKSNKSIIDSYGLSSVDIG